MLIAAGAIVLFGQDGSFVPSSSLTDPSHEVETGAREEPEAAS